MNAPMMPRATFVMLHAVLVLAVVVVVGCDSRAPSKDAAHSRPKPAVVISQVRADRNAFDPAKQETATIRFKLDKEAEVLLSIYDGRDRLIYSHKTEDLAEGDHALSWDGRDAAGTTVPAEAYTYTLTAKNAQGSSTHDLTELTGRQPIQAKDVRWDSQTGRVHYYLDNPARVNLRLGLDGGPHLRTLVDWVPRQAGAHAEAWDGKDESNVLDLAVHPMLKPAIVAYTLPDNTLFLGSAPDRVQFIADASALNMRQSNASASPKRLASHAQQPLDTRGDPDVMLTPVGDIRRDEQERWVVKGMVPFRVDVSADDRERTIQRRFEVVFYVDGVFTYESELGYLPMTWSWDATQFNPGEHFVTLNIRGYEGNFGTATVKVLIEPPDSSGAAQATADPANGN